MSVDTGGRDSESVVLDGVVRFVQIADLQTNQKAEGSPVPTDGGTVMGDISGVAALDLDSRLSTFIAWSLIAFLLATSTPLGLLMAASCISSCLWRVCRC